MTKRRAKALDAACARERHALVAGAEALRRIAAATPVGHEDVTKGPSTYTWLCYAASLLMAEAAVTPATPLEHELAALRQQVATLRAKLKKAAPWSCVACGDHITVDEDGCCTSCGSDAALTVGDTHP